jgi:signal transduction histidine kinase
MTDILLDTAMDAEQREYLSIVKSSAEALLTIINDILDFSKIEARELRLERDQFNLLESIDSAVRELNVQAKQKNLQLTAHMAPNLPRLVLGDASRLRQILINLIGNSIKFTRVGQITVTIGKSSDADEMLHFSVCDTGVGIPSDKQAVVFEAFTQADNSATRRFGGTGLGLSIAARLVAAMGGRIWVESDGRTGSTFHFTARLEPVLGIQVAPSLCDTRSSSNMVANK